MDLAGTLHLARYIRLHGRIVSLAMGAQMHTNEPLQHDTLACRQPPIRPGGGRVFAHRSRRQICLIKVPYLSFETGQRLTASGWAALECQKAFGLSPRHVQALEATVLRWPKAKDYRNLKGGWLPCFRDTEQYRS